MPSRMILLRESERDVPLPTFSSSREDIEFDKVRRAVQSLAAAALAQG